VNDELLQISGANNFGSFVPLVFVNRNSSATAAQVKNMLSAIFKAKTLKWVIFSLLLAFGLVGLGTGALLLVKVRNLQKAQVDSGSPASKPLNRSEDTSDDKQRLTSGPTIRINLSEKENARNTGVSDQDYELARE
jgi:hypothetical protein